MTEKKEHNPGGPDEPVDASGLDASPEKGRETIESREERNGGVYPWVLAAAVLGWNFMRMFFSKTAVSRGADTPHRTAVPLRTAAAPPASAPEKTGRDADRSLEDCPHIVAREKWGTLFVLCAFLIGIAAGFAFLFAYWSGGSTPLLGGTLALCLGGLGAAMVLCSHRLIRHKEATESREILPSSPEERDAASKAYRSGVRDVQRRGMLRWMIAGGVGLLAAMAVSLVRSLGSPPGDALFTRVWKHGQRLVTVEGKPITIDSLQPGSSITVFPENDLDSDKAQTVLIRVHEQLLHLPKGRGNWAPMGYVAYSRVCTHAGCPVGLFEAETNLLLCPCHQSTFDILRGAVPTGGPAARPLPQLPLYADNEGNLRAAAGFTEPPGPGFWGMP